MKKVCSVAGLPLLAVKIKRPKLHLMQSTQQVKGGRLDVVPDGNFNQGRVNICRIGQCAHKNTGSLWINLPQMNRHWLFWYLVKMNFTNTLTWTSQNQKEGTQRGTEKTRRYTEF